MYNFCKYLIFECLYCKSYYNLYNKNKDDDSDNDDNNLFSSNKMFR